MKNINQLFQSNRKLLYEAEVQELVEYCRELEGKVFERQTQDTYNKEHILRTIVSDILSSCNEYEENKILKDRYPDLYQNVNADSLVKNLMNYIITMNAKNDLRL